MSEIMGYANVCRDARPMCLPQNHAYSFAILLERTHESCVPTYHLGPIALQFQLY